MSIFLGESTGPTNCFWFYLTFSKVRSQRIKLDQTGSSWINFESNWINLDKIGSDWILLDQIGSNWNELDQTGSNWIRLDQIGSDWIRLDQIGSDWIKLDQTDQFGLNWINWFLKSELLISDPRTRPSRQAMCRSMRLFERGGPSKSIYTKTYNS